MELKMGTYKDLIPLIDTNSELSKYFLFTSKEGMKLTWKAIIIYNIDISLSTDACLNISHEVIENIIYQWIWVP